jgi:hypothetical protein
MKAYLRLTLLLALVFLVVGNLVAIGVFRDVDARFRSLIAFALIPALQAAVVLWVRRDPASRAMIAAPRALRDPLLLAVFLLDAGIVTVLLLRFRETLAVAFGIHAIVACVVVLMLLPGASRRDRWIVGLVAMALAAYGLSAFWNWLALLPFLFGRKAKILRWAAAYVPLFVLTILALLRFASAVASRSLRASGWVEWSIAMLLVSAVVVGSNVFFRPFLIEPWSTIEHVLAYGSVTALVIAALSTLRSASGGGSA